MMSTKKSSERFVLGTAQFGLDYGITNKVGQVCADEVSQILNLGWINGIDTLDTAVVYGSSENALGKLGVNEWNLITKIPPIPKGCLDVNSWVKHEINGSLNRLGLKSLYGVLLHNPTDLLGINGRELIKTLIESKKEGIIQKFGVSIYSPDELPALMKVSKFDLVQAPLSILDRRLEESGWASELNSQGIEVHARSIFLQGLLLMEDGNRTLKFGQFEDVWIEWSRWLKSNNLKPIQACVAYALGVKGVNKLVIGVESSNQLKEIIDSSNITLASYPTWPKNINPSILNPSKWGQF